MNIEETISLIAKNSCKSTGIYVIESVTYDGITTIESPKSITDNLLNNNLIEIGDQEWSF